MSKPSLFGNLFLSVGAMKAGTTWLYSVLSQHPELFFTPEKEIHYFHHRYVDKSMLSDKRRMQEANNRYLRFNPHLDDIATMRESLHWISSYLANPVDDLWYRTLFADLREQTYACDFSNLYALLPTEAWQRIALDCDQLRVLYTLRNPIKRLWSHVKFHLQFTGKIDELETWSPEDFRTFAQQSFIWNNAEYGYNLRQMKAGLPEGALKVIFFEDLHRDRSGTLASIEDFLGIARLDYPQDTLGEQVNASVTRTMPDFFPELFAEDFTRIADELRHEGLTVPASWNAMQPVPSQ